MKKNVPLSDHWLIIRERIFLNLIVVLILIIFPQISCIEQFNPKLDEYESDGLIVVEGQITDEVGPFRVKLSKTFEVDNMQRYGEPVCGADVQIFDDKGNRYPLFYTVEGWYETEDKNLRGIVGNTYTLNITLADGTQYESTPVLMQDVPQIDSVYFEESTKMHFKDGKTYDEKWLDIFLDANDPNKQTNFWKWEYEETWEVDTPKDSVHVEIRPEDEPSYMIVVNLKFEQGNARREWDNKKERCWITKPSSTILIESTSKSSVDEIDRLLVKSISPGEDELYIKYSILVKQTALSRDMYKFWEKLKEFHEQSGSLFEKMPEQIFGNIMCCDGRNKALGYFSASEVKTRRIFISPYEHSINTKNAYEDCGYFFPDRTPVKYYFGTIKEVGNPEHKEFIGMEYWFGSEWCVDCRAYNTEVSSTGSTNIKPDFWED